MAKCTVCSTRFSVFRYFWTHLPYYTHNNCAIFVISLISSGTSQRLAVTAVDKRATHLYSVLNACMHCTSHTLFRCEYGDVTIRVYCILIFPFETTIFGSLMNAHFIWNSHVIFKCICVRIRIPAERILG